MKRKPVLVIGAGGHATVLLDALRKEGTEILGILDKCVERAGSLHGIPVIGTDEDVRAYSPGEICLVNGIGSVGDPALRQQVFRKFKSWGYSFCRVLHPSAIVSDWARLGEGVQVLAGAVVGPDTVIGEDAIVNTRASVDHGCVLGCHVHIAPGAVLSGQVQVGDGSHIGTGAAVKQGIRIGAGTVVGAGSTVIRDLGDGVIAYGCPAHVK